MLRAEDVGREHHGVRGGRAGTSLSTEHRRRVGDRRGGGRRDGVFTRRARSLRDLASSIACAIRPGLRHLFLGRRPLLACPDSSRVCLPAGKLPRAWSCDCQRPLVSVGKPCPSSPATWCRGRAQERRGASRRAGVQRHAEAIGFNDISGMRIRDRDGIYVVALSPVWSPASCPSPPYFSSDRVADRRAPGAAFSRKNRASRMKDRRLWIRRRLSRDTHESVPDTPTRPIPSCFSRPARGTPIAQAPLRRGTDRPPANGDEPWTIRRRA